MTPGNALLRPFDARALSAFLFLVGLALTFLVLVGLALSRASELTQSPISCECRRGDFSNDFSPPDFDINSVDCRVFWIKNSPTIRFWSTAPHLGIRWP
jgi:hypothetical protein